MGGGGEGGRWKVTAAPAEGIPLLPVAQAKGVGQQHSGKAGERQQHKIIQRAGVVEASEPVRRHEEPAPTVAWLGVAASVRSVPTCTGAVLLAWSRHLCRLRKLGRCG